MALFAIGLAGCSSQPERQPRHPMTERPPSVDKKEARRQQDDIELLLAHYERWQGVPYRYGGTTKQGVDCSAYIQHVFRDSFAEMLPRTTLQQAKQGIEIKRSDLQTGDLVFFNVSRRTKHVGVYLEDGQFLHASTSKGVIISQLNNPYWKKRYWMSRRIQ